MESGLSPFRTWFGGHLGQPTEVQVAAWSRIQAGGSVLIVSPPGTGKTLAAFLPILDQLALKATAGRLPD